MKTKAIIEWLHGYADGLSVLGNCDRADMIRMVVTHMEELERRVRVAEAEIERLRHDGT